MPRLLRRVLLLLLLLGTWVSLSGREAPLPLFNQAVAGSRWEGPHDPPRSNDKPPHDLPALRLFTKAVLDVNNSYVDPKRVKPKEMLVAALDYVEKTVPDVIVEGTPESGKLKVTVGNRSQTFDISAVDSLWKMSFNLKNIFRFIGENMRSMEDTREVEYAAINGMLSKLDPHSVLLRPEQNREIKLSTKGEFAGLGFVVHIKEGNLTVVKVLPKTPAYRAGVKKDDQIKRINDESTVNMDLNEAVSKLRGPVDSKVTIAIERKGWEKPQSITVSRAMISIESVQSKLLSHNVGYIRLKNFQGNTTRDLQTALNNLNKESEAQGGIKGLVLDMRGNPGGLLEQAIQVSDLFLSSGTIVATVGMADKLREEKKAHSDEADNASPIVVLVNAGSASASEIVAGALKNLNRAVIIGRQTFGKGSVQVLNDFPDDSALKLTVAKYLTPGDLSIQEVGIVPDIDLVPARVTKDRVDVFAPRRSVGEADLESHFSNPSNATAAKKRDDVLREKPAEQLRYLKEDSKQKDASAKQQLQEEGKAPKLSKVPVKGKPQQKDPLLDIDRGLDQDLDDQLDAESQDEIKEDFEVLFARDFVLKAPFLERGKMLAAAKTFVDQRRKQEQERINAAIAALGVDWTAGETPKSPQLAAQLRPGPDAKLMAGELLEMEVSVENRGTEPFHRLRAWTESADNPFLDRREFVFGTVKPGEKKSWMVPVRLPADLTSRRDAVSLKLQDDSGMLTETVSSEMNFVEQPRPVFAFSWQVEDRCDACNGDGRIQRGETLDFAVDITNVGSGKAQDAFAQIKNAADMNIFIDKGRFKLGEIAPGETKTAHFEFEVKKGYRTDTFPLKLAIIDEKLEEFATEKLQLRVEEPVNIEQRKGTLKIAEQSLLYPAPDAQSRPIAKLPQGAVFSELGRANGFYKVEMDKDRFAFVKAADAKEGYKGKVTANKEINYLSYRTPPQINLNVDSSKGGLLADTDRFTLSGTAENAQNILDLYVLVNDQKVFFKTVAAPPGQSTSIKFTTDFPLKEGNNNVLVVARESPDFASRKSLIIRRRPAAFAQSQNPEPAKQ